MLAALGEAAVRTMLLAGAVQGILWLLRVRPPQLLLPAWTAVLFASVAMPVLPYLLPLHVPLGTPFSRPLFEGVAGLVPEVLLWAAPEDSAGEIGTPLARVSWLVALYLVVSGTMLLRVVLGVGLSLRLLCRAVPVRPDWAGGTRLRISRDVAGPVTVANVVLLPVDAPLWPAETQRAVLAHERAHVARWDFAMLVASQLNRALFWFSPLPWWLHRQLVTLSELASDDQALLGSDDRLRYAEILLEMGRRCTPAPRDPAMARPATLCLRIERILLDQVPGHPVGRPLQVVLALGVGSLSLVTAGLGPRPVIEMVSPALRQATDGDMAAHGPTAPSWAVLDVTPPSVAPQPGMDAMVGTRPQPIAPSAPRVATVVAAPQPPPRALQQAGRQALRAASKGTSPPQQPRAIPQPITAAFTDADREGGATATRQATARLAPPYLAEIIQPASTASNPSNEISPLLAQQIAFGSLHLAVPPEFQAILASVCTGSVIVGQRAQSSSDKPPYVVGGQVVPARAHFFARSNGTPWVRFDAFDRPPLDLPVRFTRYGMTWTGEYGIAYTVRAADGTHLAGLAALVRGDSAMLDFSCVRSRLHVL